MSFFLFDNLAYFCYILKDNIALLKTNPDEVIIRKKFVAKEARPDECTA